MLRLEEKLVMIHLIISPQIRSWYGMIHQKYLLFRSLKFRELILSGSTQRLVLMVWYSFQSLLI